MGSKPTITKWCNSNGTCVEKPVGEKVSLFYVEGHIMIDIFCAIPYPADECMKISVFLSKIMRCTSFILHFESHWKTLHYVV